MSAQKLEKRGGPRPGSGRKRGAPRSGHTVRLDDFDWAKIAEMYPDLPVHQAAALILQSAISDWQRQQS